MELTREIRNSFHTEWGTIVLSIVYCNKVRRKTITFQLLFWGGLLPGAQEVFKAKLVVFEDSPSLIAVVGRDGGSSTHTQWY